jgi:hypothetical protein
MPVGPELCVFRDVTDRGYVSACFGPAIAITVRWDDAKAKGSSRGHDVSFSRAGQGTDAGTALGAFGPTPGTSRELSLGL